ncbi:hypothetical protein [Methylobacterium oryzihabitans]|uniref:Uncharacterized protein n=1 Tax=Methylobacterium oryzihabitans TaxID=2499852 RepID=A0A3S2YUH9_9HYPH|nr:hypothetical protein [Methylobacterium oryzihabitans]RVU19702.1 hypothetical protein EOE48_07045 [Methylobacterium oryzihabitans]
MTAASGSRILATLAALRREGRDVVAEVTTGAHADDPRFDGHREMLGVEAMDAVGARVAGIEARLGAMPVDE